MASETYAGVLEDLAEAKTRAPLHSDSWYAVERAANTIKTLTATVSTQAGEIAGLERQVTELNQIAQAMIAESNSFRAACIERVAERDAAEAENARLVEAAKPFDKVFNDNGDLTLDLSGPTAEELKALHFALRTQKDKPHG